MMNIGKLKEFNRALANLSDEIKDMSVDMGSAHAPACGTPACFAGLISIVAKDLPELSSCAEPYSVNTYDYAVWAYALSRFLGFDSKKKLVVWAIHNPELWGCQEGDNMFYYESAFVDDTLSHRGSLRHRDLIDWWAQVEENIIMDKDIL